MQFKKASINGIMYDDVHDQKGGLREVIEVLNCYYRLFTPNSKPWGSRGLQMLFKSKR